MQSLRLKGGSRSPTQDVCMGPLRQKRLDVDRGAGTVGFHHFDGCGRIMSDSVEHCLDCEYQVVALGADEAGNATGVGLELLDGS